MKRVISTLVCGWIALECASAGQHDELAVWVKQDCDDAHTFAAQTGRARSAHEVAAAMRENLRRQSQTIKTLLRFVRSHPNLRSAAQLGLSEEGQQLWNQQHRTGTAPPAEIVATEKQLHDCLDAVGPEAQQQMVAALRKYHDDAEVISASTALHQMWAENDRSLLTVLGQP
jgi:hypothetical protein